MRPSGDLRGPRRPKNQRQNVIIHICKSIHSTKIDHFHLHFIFVYGNVMTCLARPCGSIIVYSYQYVLGLGSKATTSLAEANSRFALKMENSACFALREISSYIQPPNSSPSPQFPKDCTRYCQECRDKNNSNGDVRSAQLVVSLRRLAKQQQRGQSPTS